MPSLIEGISRSDIVATTVSTLAAASTAAESRVFRGRVERASPEEMPCLSVFVLEQFDTVQLPGMSSLCTPTFDRITRIVVEGWVCDDTDQDGDVDLTTDDAVDAALDSLAEETRAALVGSTTWLQAVTAHEVPAMRTSVGFAREGSRRTGQFRVEIEITHTVQYG